MLHGVQHGQHLPVASRQGSVHTDAARNSPACPGHLRRNAVLIPINQVFRRCPTKDFDEGCALAEVFFRVPLGGVERLFSAAAPAFHYPPQLRKADALAGQGQLRLHIAQHHVRTPFEHRPHRLLDRHRHSAATPLRRSRRGPVALIGANTFHAQRALTRKRSPVPQRCRSLGGKEPCEPHTYRDEWFCALRYGRTAGGSHRDQANRDFLIISAGRFLMEGLAIAEKESVYAAAAVKTLTEK